MVDEAKLVTLPAQLTSLWFEMMSVTQKRRTESSTVSNFILPEGVTAVIASSQKVLNHHSQFIILQTLTTSSMHQYCFAVVAGKEVSVVSMLCQLVCEAFIKLAGKCLDLFVQR